MAFRWFFDVDQRAEAVRAAGCNVPLKAAAPCSVVIAQNSLNQKAE